MKIRISPPYILLSCVLAVIALLHGWAALSALQSSACPGVPGCYPWGAEGPVAGNWRYESKENYALVNSAQMMVVIAFWVIATLRFASESRHVQSHVGLWLLGATWALLFIP